MTTKTDLAKQFNQIVRELITRAEKKTRNEVVAANLDRARQRLNLLVSNMGVEAPLAEAYPFFIEYHGKITEPVMEIRDKFFLELDVRGECVRRGKIIGPEDEFLFSLTDAIRDLYKKVSVQEKNEVYLQVNGMLQCSLQYALQL